MENNSPKFILVTQEVFPNFFPCVYNTSSFRALLFVPFGSRSSGLSEVDRLQDASAQSCKLTEHLSSQLPLRRPPQDKWYVGTRHTAQSIESQLLQSFCCIFLGTNYL